MAFNFIDTIIVILPFFLYLVTYVEITSLYISHHYKCFFKLFTVYLLIFESTRMTLTAIIHKTRKKTDITMTDTLRQERGFGTD